MTSMTLTRLKIAMRDATWSRRTRGREQNTSKRSAPEFYVSSSSPTTTTPESRRSSVRSRKRSKGRRRSISRERLLPPNPRQMPFRLRKTQPRRLRKRRRRRRNRLPITRKQLIWLTRRASEILLLFVRKHSLEPITTDFGLKHSNANSLQIKKRSSSTWKFCKRSQPERIRTLLARSSFGKIISLRLPRPMLRDLQRQLRRLQKKRRRIK